MKVCIDPGHGGKEHGAIGNYMDEKDINLKLAILFGEVLEKNGVSVVYTRKKDQYIELQDRCNIANKNKCNYFISFHCNSSSNGDECGSGIFYNKFGDDSKKLASHLNNVLIRMNNNINLGVNEGDFFILKYTYMPSILIQIMFISNQVEEKKLNDEIWQRLIIDELAHGFLSFIGLNPDNKYSLMSNNKNKIPIMGTTLSTAQQMEDFLHSKNPDAPYLAKLYISASKDEGVRGDIAFAQTLLETNFFRSMKNYDDHNYIGIKLIDTNEERAIFDTPIDGIRAHIQLLKAYASTERLNTPLVNPIFHFIPRGVALYWEDLDEHWIIPKSTYGKKIIELWKKIIKITPTNETNNFNTVLSQWIDKGLIPNDIDLDKPLTWKEFIIFQDSLMKRE